jgi:hypothetical protein
MRLVAFVTIFLSLFLQADGQAYARAYQTHIRYTGIQQTEKSNPVKSGLSNPSPLTLKTSIEKKDAGDIAFEDAEEDYLNVLNARWIFLTTVIVAFLFIVSHLHRFKKVTGAFILPVYQYYIRFRVIKI